MDLRRVAKTLKKFIMKTIVTTLKILIVFSAFSIIALIGSTKPTVTGSFSISISSIIDDIEKTSIKQEVLTGVNNKITNAVNKLADKEEFITETRKIAAELGVDPNLLLAKFYVESRIDPTKKNKDTGASGIFQIMWFNLPDGMTLVKFRQLSATEQLKHYRTYILPYKKYIKEIEDLYVANICPAALIEGRKILYKYPSKEYTQNDGLDVNKDGKITRQDIRKVILRYLTK